MKSNEYDQLKSKELDSISINSDKGPIVDNSHMKKVLEDYGLKVNNSMSKVLLKRLYNELEAYIYNNGELPEYLYEMANEEKKEA